MVCFLSEKSVFWVQSPFLTKKNLNERKSQAIAGVCLLNSKTNLVELIVQKQIDTIVILDIFICIGQCSVSLLEQLL